MKKEKMGRVIVRDGKVEKVISENINEEEINLALA